MVPKSKAVAVAKDVLENLDGLDIQRGSFVRANRPGVLKHFDKLKSYIAKLRLAKKECQVCALGAAYLSSFNLPEFKGQAPDSLYYDTAATNRVIDCAKEIFGEDTPEIETAFEMGNGWGMGQISGARYYNAAKFGDQFSSAKDRLRAIMQNVVDNDGYFMPGENGKNAVKYGGSEPLFDEDKDY